MRIRRLLTAGAMTAFSGLAAADPCTGPSPFVDVDPGALYCTNTEWLANRNVTLGCTSTEYCPNPAVTRAQMALFMNRLGVALTPETRVTDDSGGAVDLDNETFHCVSPAYTIAEYPRTMILHGHFSGLTVGAASYDINIRYNTTGSTTEFPLFINSNFEKAGSPAATWSHASTSAVLALDAGTTYRFAIRVIRDVDIGTEDLSATTCQLVQHLINRNAATPPLDKRARGGRTDE